MRHRVERTGGVETLAASRVVDAAGDRLGRFGGGPVVERSGRR